jgi:hypothetical protein
MRNDEVPQEDSLIHQGERKAMYALDQDGRYRVVPSSGWKVEETATAMAVAAYAEAAAAALARVRAGHASPIEYHMYRHRLDSPTLAQETGLWHWQVKRHFRPAVFARLGERTLRRYAQVFGMAIDELRGGL